MAALTRSPDGVDVCTESDLPELLEFQARMYGEGSRQIDADRTAWLFVDHPYRPPEGLALWVYRSQGQIIASRGALPFHLKVGTGQVSAAWAIDSMVDPAWRGTGIAHELGDQAWGSTSLPCSLGLSEAGARFARRRGSSDLGNMTSHFWLADARAFLPTVVRLGPLARSLEPLAPGFSRLAAGLCRLLGATTRLRAIERFDERADHLWEAASPAYPVIGQRDLTWLSWRFDRSPDRSAYRRYYVAQGERIVGYVVLRPRSWEGRPGLEVIDYLAAPRHLPGLFANAALLARREGVAALICRTHNARSRRALKLLGFLRGHHGVPFMVRLPANGQAARVLGDPENWFLTAADSDVD